MRSGPPFASARSNRAKNRSTLAVGRRSRPCDPEQLLTALFGATIGLPIRMSSGVLMMSHAKSPTSGLAAVAVDELLNDYEHERISLGRLSDLLGMDPGRTMELLRSRGVALRFGPTTVDEAIEDWRTIERIESQ